MESKPINPYNKVEDFIQIWKKSNAQMELEMETFRKSQEYQDAIFKLKKRNEVRGTPIV